MAKHEGLLKFMEFFLPQLSLQFIRFNSLIQKILLPFNGIGLHW